MTRKEIGIKIKEKRLQLGLTQVQLSEKTGAGVSIISRIERAKYSSSIDLVVKILKCIQLEINILDIEK
jgi:transcriptional regulator with XRE-family HTH domain